MSLHGGLAGDGDDFRAHEQHRRLYFLIMPSAGLAYCPLNQHLDLYSLLSANNSVLISTVASL